MENYVHGPKIGQRIGHVMLNQRESRSLDQMGKIGWTPGAEIVNADHLRTHVEQRVTQVRSDEAGAAKHHRAIESPVSPLTSGWLRQPRGAVSACSLP
jgi:hypothetical protein